MLRRIFKIPMSISTISQLVKQKEENTDENLVEEFPNNVSREKRPRPSTPALINMI